MSLIKQKNLFVYGTLMFDEVHSALLDRVLVSEEATLYGFARVAIQREEGGAKGPVIFQEKGGEVQGCLLPGVDAVACEVIDLFESAASGYNLTQVVVVLRDGREVSAETYVGTDSLKRLVAGSWTVEQFRENFLDHYISERIPALRRKWQKK